MHASKTQNGSSAGKDRFVKILWIVVLAIGAYFVWDNVPRYLTLTEESYGPYYWPRAAYLLPHILGGLAAIVIGPFQFWSRIRNGYPRVHRISGRVYLSAILVGGLAGLAMALTSDRGVSYASGLFGLGIAWLSTSGMALAAIRRRNFLQHKQWMIRSYVVTFAFVSFRIVDDTLVYLQIGERLDYLPMLAWACWAVPLLVTELVIQGRQVFAKS